MNNKMKNRVVTTAISIFFLIIGILCTISYFHPITYSESERRDLAQFPTNITAERIFDKTAILEFEDYTVDQFPFREVFR
ncbi:MAG: hypothetical protein PUB22_08455, partial [Clostridiales bacterium]|nr:hypothetical protein [Clostridiales bacterium]